jgi:hypothetical protein
VGGQYKRFVQGHNNRTKTESHESGVIVSDIPNMPRMIGLYEALESFADNNNHVHVGILRAVTRTRRSNMFKTRNRLDPELVEGTFNQLLEMGAVIQIGVRTVKLVTRPDLTPSDSVTPTGTPPESTAVTSRRRKAVENLPGTATLITDPLVATAIARDLWERYEWAINEIGKLTEQLQTLTNKSS